jgi:pimeloyl-ACP methyl ester carboxylesterase
MKTLLILLGCALCLVLVFLAYVYVFQEKLLYPAPRTVLPNTLPVGIEKVELAHGYGLYLKARTDAPGPLLIFTHGNGETAYFWKDEFEALRQAGIAVLLLEYPGYAGAAGDPNLASIQGGILSAFDNLSKRPEIDAGKVIAYGRSIGSGAATLLAAQRPLVALCLEAPFSSLARLVKEKGYPPFLLKDRYDNEAIVRQLEIPLFLYHGSRDVLIPLSHSETLAEAGKDVTLIVADCGHNDCPRP